MGGPAPAGAWAGQGRQRGAPGCGLSRRPSTVDVADEGRPGLEWAQIFDAAGQPLEAGLQLRHARIHAPQLPDHMGSVCSVCRAQPVRFGPWPLATDDKAYHQSYHACCQ
ncbi:hypothetical protein [uncultured Pseudacidovorax sp.]|uniref:hypothetical protein n=1 Tax=uncultured Pseudacidovorax sp. TaxID=679313 RepID=UPI0025D89504|nr:hypothetical protein [uncultured Pseudacidovorax sp.]